MGKKENGQHDKSIPLAASFTRIDALLKKGMRVLDICSSNKLPVLRAAIKGTSFRCIDRDEKTRRRLKHDIASMGLHQNIETGEDGFEDLHQVPAETFDAVLLCFSVHAMNLSEFQYALRHAKRALKRNGILIIADIAVPSHFIKRVICFLKSVITVPVDLALKRCLKMPLIELHMRILNAGFTIKTEMISCHGAIMELIALK